MKKIMSLIMITAMLSNSALANNATTGVSDHQKMIAKSFNDFRYKMTVDVDPKDSRYQARAIADFKQRMATLQDKGVSSEEIMNFMRSSMLDTTARADFDRMLSTIDVEKVSGEEAGNLAMQFMASRYQQGASYSGGGKGSYKIAMVVIGVVIIGVVTYLLIKHIKDQKAKTVTETATKTDTETLTKTSVETSTETVTNVSTVTETSVITNVETVNNTETVTSYETVVTTKTETSYETVTNTYTHTYTDTQYNTVTNTVTYTDTCTDTNTSYGYCCNTVSGHVVPASPTGCDNGVALTFVTSPELCIKLGPPGFY